MQTLKQQWKTFENGVIPVEAGQTQRDEMQNAFMAGAAAFFDLSMVIADIEDEQKASNQLEIIQEEINRYFMTKIPEGGKH